MNDHKLRIDAAAVAIVASLLLGGCGQIKQFVKDVDSRADRAAGEARESMDKKMQKYQATPDLRSAP